MSRIYDVIVLECFIESIVLVSFCFLVSILAYLCFNFGRFLAVKVDEIRSKLLKGKVKEDVI